MTTLSDVLAAEHAAIYAYGVLGARLDLRARQLALRAFDAHRAVRDVLQARLVGQGITPPVPAAAYDVTVASRASALALAARLETDLGVLWRDLVADARTRALAVQQLQDAAVRAALWRRAAGSRPWTRAFPGQAGTVEP